MLLLILERGDDASNWSTSLSRDPGLPGVEPITSSSRRKKTSQTLHCYKLTYAIPCVGGGKCGFTPKAFCKTKMTMSEASSGCSNAGGRLCTKAELLSGLGKGTGCNFDVSYVRTSTSCGIGSILVHWKQKKTICRSDDFKGHVRCCSDP